MYSLIIKIVVSSGRDLCCPRCPGDARPSRRGPAGTVTFPPRSVRVSRTQTVPIS